MKASTLFTLYISLVLSSLLPSAFAEDATTVEDTIVNNAAADNIDFSVLNVTDALTEISSIWENATVSYTDYTTSAQKRSLGRFSSRDARQSLATFLSTGKRVDVHTHVVPSWYRTLVPITGGNPTPLWDLDSYTSFLDSEGIDRAVFSFSAPGANVFPGQKGPTVALARLINEQSAAFAALLPGRFRFFAVVPLPYVQEAITEAQYALTKLGAAGIILLSNYEGNYLGSPTFKPFFQALHNMSGKKVVFIHPTTPELKVGGKLIEANPTVYVPGTIEFYFETARTMMDLTMTQTLQNFTSINYIVPHVGGAFPAVIDRFLKPNPALYNSAMAVYTSRLWWDSAGPTYFHQISGLLGYGIPKSQLLFGTDFPYVPPVTLPGSLAAIISSALLTDADRTALFTTNAVNAFQGVNA